MVLATMLGTASQAHASAKGVGLGVAAGAVSSGTESMDSKKAWEPVFMGILRRYPSDIDLLHLTGDDAL